MIVQLISTVSTSPAIISSAVGSSSMSLLLRISDRRFSLSSEQGFRKFSPTTISRISTRFYSLEVQRFSLRQYKSQGLYFAPGNGDAFDISDVRSSSSDHEGTQENDGGRQEKSFKSNEMMRKLKRYGISGILSYGLLNTVYYLTTFLLVWFYIAPAPGRMGYIAAVERFLKVMAMVWAGSQVTKLVRAGGALALAPFVDRGLSWFTVKLKFESQGKAFMAVVGFCFGLAFILFLVVTLLWA